MMPAKRFQFNSKKFFPVQVKQGEYATIAYIYDLSESGICFGIPKRDARTFFKDLVWENEGTMVNNKIGFQAEDVYENMPVTYGQKLQIKMAPLRLGMLTCNARLVHSREVDGFVLYGAELENVPVAVKDALNQEIEGAVVRKGPVRKTPWTHKAAWLSGVAIGFALLARWI
jgi:hypothetical protein